MPTRAERLRFLMTALAHGQSGPQADFTLTRGTDAAKWYSRRGTESFGSVTGDLVLPVAGTIDRVWYRTTTLTFNGAGGSWSNWRAGPGAAATFTVTTPHGEVVYAPADQHSVGGGFIGFTCSNADVVIFAQVAAGEEVRVVIT